MDEPIISITSITLTWLHFWIAIGVVGCFLMRGYLFGCFLMCKYLLGWCRDVLRVIWPVFPVFALLVGIRLISDGSLNKQSGPEQDAIARRNQVLNDLGGTNFYTSQNADEPPRHKTDGEKRRIRREARNKAQVPGKWKDLYDILAKPIIINSTTVIQTVRIFVRDGEDLPKITIGEIGFLVDEWLYLDSRSERRDSKRAIFEICGPYITL